MSIDNPFLRPPLEIVVGDCKKLMRKMPAESVDCIVTSPPYYGLRDYDHPGQVGCEESPRAYIKRLVEIFAECYRVLAPHGTMWVNLGDAYNGRPGGGQGENGQMADRAIAKARLVKRAKPGDTPAEEWRDTFDPNNERKRARDAYRSGGKQGDIMGLPWKLAFALQEWGWYLRQDIIWSKPNPLPESVNDRCTKSHEYVFLLTKSGRPTCWRARDTREWRIGKANRPDLTEMVPNPTKEDPEGTRKRWQPFKYYFDQSAIAEPVSAAMMQQVAEGYKGESDNWFPDTQAQNPSDTKSRIIEGARGRLAAAGDPKYQVDKDAPDGPSRMLENLTLAREQSGSHDAPFGLTANKRSVWQIPTGQFKGAHFATFPKALVKPMILAGCPVGGVTLDIFGGSGTTGEVAVENGRKAIIMEINPAYADLAVKRTHVTYGLPLE